MQQKMPKQETMTQAHIRKAQGAFLLAHRMGLIEDPSMEGLKARRQKHNEELRRMEQEGQRFYGPHYFSAPAYLQYELTRLKLDFVQPCEKVREGGYCRISRSRRSGIFTNRIEICSDAIMGIILPMRRCHRSLRNGYGRMHMTSLSATYYVSQRTGSDENDGRTCSTAFASLSAVEDTGSTATVSCWNGAVYFTDNICM